MEGNKQGSQKGPGKQSGNKRSKGRGGRPQDDRNDSESGKGSEPGPEETGGAMPQAGSLPNNE